MCESAQASKSGLQTQASRCRGIHCAFSAISNTRWLEARAPATYTAPRTKDSMVRKGNETYRRQTSPECLVSTPMGPSRKLRFLQRVRVSRRMEDTGGKGTALQANVGVTIQGSLGGFRAGRLSRLPGKRLGDSAAPLFGAGRWKTFRSRKRTEDDRVRVAPCHDDSQSRLAEVEPSESQSSQRPSRLVCGLSRSLLEEQTPAH